MSKDVLPQVGDVFSTKSLGLCRVIETNENVSNCLIKEPNGVYSILPVFNSYLTRSGKLIGNSKINIEQLFETENE